MQKEEGFVLYIHMMHSRQNMSIHGVFRIHLYIEQSGRIGHESTQKPGTRPFPSKPKGGLGELFEHPQVCHAGVMQIELAGNTEAVVSGCTGVLEYDENIIRLTGGK